MDNHWIPNTVCDTHTKKKKNTNACLHRAQDKLFCRHLMRCLYQNQEILIKGEDKSSFLLRPPLKNPECILLQHGSPKHPPIMRHLFLFWAAFTLPSATTLKALSVTFVSLLFSVQKTNLRRSGFRFHEISQITVSGHKNAGTNLTFSRQFLATHS